MPARSPTNTLILTNTGDELLNRPQPLMGFLARDKAPAELVALPKFGRLLLVCESAAAAVNVRALLKASEWSYLRISYSLHDNHMTTLDESQLVMEEVEYLELPLDVGSRRFLISPPLSPPAEWSHWDKVEEGPNKESVHAPEELSHLLWERLGGFGSSNVRKYHGESDDEDDDDDGIDLQAAPEVLFEDINNGVPAIVLDTVKNRNMKPSARIGRTPMPPMDCN